VGVWILCLVNALLFGLVPCLVILELSLRPPDAGGAVVPWGMAIPTLLLGAGIIYCSVLAWQGNVMGRNLLVGLLTVQATVVVINNVSVLTAGGLSSDQSTRIYMNIARSLIWVAANYWYFMGDRPRQFFQARG
jgi:hypothetical protein